LADEVLVRQVVHETELVEAWKIEPGNLEDVERVGA
jgi:hypothetical protein